MSIERFESSCFETLWSQFTAQLDRPLSHPLATEKIIVPASGWESYINRRLTNSLGCWAQFDFATLGGWINQTLCQWLPDEVNASREADAFTWLIASRLPELVKDDDFDCVRSYLRADGDSAETRRLIDLSRQLGGLFDQYTLYRPEMLDAWDAGNDWISEGNSPKHARWQRKLWQNIGEIKSFQSVSSLIDQLPSAIDSGTGLERERVSVWICGGLPPAHIQFLDSIGKTALISLYIFSPPYACWGNASKQQEQVCKWIDGGESMRSFCQQNQLADLHPLLNSLGELSRQRIRLLATQQNASWKTIELAQDSGPAKKTTLLARLQSGLLAGGVPSNGSVSVDKSIRVHSCHSPTREVEVLRDEIRDALENDDLLRPEDIVVLCPDLETYAPIVDSVFGLTRSSQEGHVPYQIAGRSPRRTRPIIDAFFRVLDVLQGRFSLPDVLDLLSDELIASAVKMTPDDVADFFSWVSDSGVRWGVDAEHRSNASLPESDLNTWEFGLNRLLMGYAMPPGGGQLVGSTVALDRVQGLDGEKLGKGWTFIQKLCRWREEISDSRPVDQWRKPLCEIAEIFIDTTQDEAGAQKIRTSIDQLINGVEKGTFKQSVSFAIVASELAHQTDLMSSGASFQLGGMTVCEMAARRGIPSKVVAMLGMSDGAFPRVDRHVGFDLLPSKPQLGDRSLRLEDKHLFLEALMSAGHRLVITYQGQNVRNLRTRPPSVLVEELLDAIERGGGGDDEEKPISIREQVIVRHPLQAFSHHYFDSEDQRLFGYDNSQLRAAKAIWDGPTEVPIFAPKPLPETDLAEEISVIELRRVISRPWEIFLNRLGLYLGEDFELDDTREPLVLNALQAWSLGDTWLNRRMDGEEADLLTRSLKRGGSLPAGGLGEQVLAKVRIKADEVAEAARMHGVDPTVKPHPIRVTVGDTTIVGRINGLTPDGLRFASYSKVKAKQVIRLWLDHLLATLSTGHAIGPAILVGQAKKPGEDRIELRTISPQEAKIELEKLLVWYGLSLRFPLPIFPNALASVVSGMFKGGDIEDETSARQMMYFAESEYLYQKVGIAEADLFSVRTSFAGREPMRITWGDLPGFESKGDMSLFHSFVHSVCQPMVDRLERLGKPRANA